MSKLQSIRECLENPESMLHVKNQMHPISMRYRDDRKLTIDLLINNHINKKWQSANEIIFKGGEKATDSLRVAFCCKLNRKSHHQ